MEKRPRFSLFPKTIKSQMIVLISAVILLQLSINGGIFANLVASFLENQIGQKALRIAQTVALIPDIRRAVTANDPDRIIQPLAESIRIETGAAYIVVGDKNGIRFSHPNPERIGEKFVGGDEEGARLEGRSYISQGVGTLGPAMRGMAPVFAEDGRLAGFVSVGYLKGNIREIVAQHQRQPVLIVCVIIIISLSGAVLIANWLKRVTLGLEPAQIADLFLERSAILESVREGIIAVNSALEIRMINKAALSYLGFAKADSITGRHIDDVLPGTPMRESLTQARTLLDQELTVKGTVMVFNLIPVGHGEKIEGVVASFRRKDELDALARELTHVREASEMLRVQSHEYSNKLHTIAGLIQIEAYQEALDLILQESHSYHEMMELVSEAVPHPLLSGLIIGKYNRAQELKTTLLLDRDSSMKNIPESINQEKIATILGNLIDNAFDAVKDSPADARTITLCMNDQDDSLTFSVSDSGHGIPQDMENSVFEKGVSTKSAGRGVGLFLAMKNARELGGTLSFERLSPGTRFTLRIPLAKEQA